MLGSLGPKLRSSTIAPGERRLSKPSRTREPFPRSAKEMITTILYPLEPSSGAGAISPRQAFGCGRMERRQTQYLS